MKPILLRCLTTASQQYLAFWALSEYFIQLLSVLNHESTETVKSSPNLNIIQKKQSFLWRIFTVKITETCELLSCQQHCLQHQLLISTVWFLIHCVFSFSLYLRSPSFSVSFLSPTIKLEVFLSLIENYENISTSFSILGLEEGKSRNSVLGRKLKSVAHAPSSFLFRLFPVEMYASLHGTNWMLVQQKILWSFFLFWVCFPPLFWAWRQNTWLLEWLSNTEKSSSLFCTKQYQFSNSYIYFSVTVP